MSVDRGKGSGGDGFVPTFEVTLEGRRVDPGVLHRMVDLTYSDGLDRIDSVRMTVADQPGGSAFTYVDDEFLPGRKVELFLGYLGKLSRVMTGEITAVQLNLPSSQNPTVGVTAQNVLHRLRDRQRCVVYENKTDSQIAQEIAQRLGVTIRTEPAGEQPYAYQVQDNEYDIVFLLRRARRIGYELWAVESDSGRTELHFKPPRTAGPPAVRLGWGSNLLEFESFLDVSRQVNQVIVYGWDGLRKKPIVAKAGGGQSGTTQKAFARRADVVRAVVGSEHEAHRYARGRLREIAGGLVRTTGKTVGQPGLRAGCLATVEGLGKRFSGTYLVTSTRHTFDRAGYRTSFESWKVG